MKKIVRSVKSYDDVYLAEGREIEADHEVTITVDGEAQTLDLTPANLAKFRKDMAFWLRVATTVRAGKRAGRSNPPVCRQPTAGMAIDEGKKFLAGMRSWALAEGKGDLFWPKGKTSFSYSQELVDAYKRHLLQELVA